MSDHLSKQFFFVIGAQRSGTTFLYNFFKQLAPIHMAEPVVPEPKFFLKPNCLSISQKEYIELYHSTAKDDVILFGEKSTSYYEIGSVAKKIKTFAPQAKVICILRDPVERALSNFFFSKKHGIETRSLEEVFLHKVLPPALKRTLSVDPFNYLGRGEYYKLLQPFFSVFQEQMNVFFFEELTNDISALKKVLSFLDITVGINDKVVLSKKNSAERLETVPQKVVELLQDYYKRPNQQLASFLDRKIDFWS